MRSRSLLRVFFNLLLAAGLVLPGIAAPAQAAADEIAVMASGGTAVAHSLCDGMQMPMPDKTPASGKHGCDLASCLGAACLPVLSHLGAFVPKAGSLIVGD